ncbi:putative membrane protein [Spinactinospora alkalitolerans]|uniref:Putative membrane protein n=1 Tax=Spinactinospora alkalitolerans TaxID=687207 RepID=A0A852TSW5_9ACTN|nr:PH domain-containing protein [Spinactinospora alkalitolerans]NYE46731.1 putative membrane protein [Spinactinospora alkalitolerans]
MSGGADGADREKPVPPVPEERPAEETPPPAAEPPAREDSPEEIRAEPERRLSGLTTVTAPINYLKSFIVPIVVALVAGSFNPWVLGSSAVALAGMLVTGFVTWWTVRYQVGAERLEIRRGLIGRSRRTIPLERIRGVDVTSTLLHRALGLAVVKIEAAAGGGGQEEGKLDAVTRAEAERLRGELLHRRAVLRGDAAARAGADPVPAGAGEQDGAAPRPEPEAAEPETVYFEMPRGWYLYAVLSLGYLLTPFAALAAVLGFLAQIVDDLAIDVDPDEAAGLAQRIVDSGAAALILLAVAAAALLLVLMPVFAVASYAINHWGFTLRRRGEALVTERGLFTRQSVTLEHRRIRGHELIDNPLQRVRRAVQLRAIVTGLGDVSTRAALLPIGPRERVDAVVEQALAPYRGTLTAHPPAARTRRLFRAVVPAALVAAAAAGLGLYWVAALFALSALLGVPLGLDRYRSLGHGYDGRRVSVRSGSLRREQAVVRRDAIIGWKWRQSPFQRRADLATLEVTVGAGSGGYDAVDADFAESVSFASGVTPHMVGPFLAKEGRRPREDGEEEEA